MEEQELQNEAYNKIQAELEKSDDYTVFTSYYDISAVASCLDGWFTAAALRMIADEMDRLKGVGQDEPTGK